MAARSTWYPWPVNDVMVVLGRIEAKLNLLEYQQEKIMSELDDAQTAMTNLAAAVTSGTAELKALADKIVALLAAPGGVDPAAVKALAVQIQSTADAINQGVADAKAEAGV